MSRLIPGAASSEGRKARGVATAPAGYIRALTIFARDSYGRPIHFRAIIVTTVDSRRRCRPRIYRHSPQDPFHHPAIRFFRASRLTSIAEPNRRNIEPVQSDARRRG